MTKSLPQRLSQSASSLANLQHRRRSLRFERLETRTMLAGHGDFNGDGRDDLAIGAPNESVGTIASAGAVHVIYGGRKGLSATGSQTWTQNSSGVDGVAAANDNFGAALAVGDFNGDGFDDLAIGVSREMVNGHVAAGAVNVLFGSQNGLTAASDQLWTQDSSGINDQTENGDQFGWMLAAGDFNGDGRDDLAIDAPGEAVGSLAGAGAVNVIYGSASRLTSAGDQFWHQDSSGINDQAEAGDQFGGALAAGDFNGDGRDDLAIGVPREDVGALVDAGAVNLLYGSASGLTGSGDQFWTQDSAGVIDDAEAGDYFGSSAAAGDFNGDGFDDLAVGVPKEALGATMSAGRVNVLYGSPTKLTALGNSYFVASVLGFASLKDAEFGHSLAAGDFDGDGRDDLAIGAPYEDIGAAAGAGAVYAVYGSEAGLGATGAQRWVQGASSFGDLPDSPEANNQFGFALTAGDFNGDGRSDLAIGVPGEAFGAATGAGMVHVLYGFFVSGLFDIGNSFWHQGLLSSSDGIEASDYFGGVLA